jgi:hypothetical protein
VWGEVWWFFKSWNFFGDGLNFVVGCFFGWLPSFGIIKKMATPQSSITCSIIFNVGSKGLVTSVGGLAIEKMAGYYQRGSRGKWLIIDEFQCEMEPLQNQGAKVDRQVGEPLWVEELTSVLSWLLMKLQNILGSPPPSAPIANYIITFGFERSEICRPSPWSKSKGSQKNTPACLLANTSSPMCNQCA